MIESIKEASRKSAYFDDIGLEVLEVKDGCATGRIKIQEKMINPYGAVHGGVIFGFADTIGGMGLLGKISSDKVVTSTGTINYLRGAVNTEYLIARSTPVKIGRTLAVYNVEVVDQDERLISTAVMNYFIL